LPHAQEKARLRMIGNGIAEQVYMSGRHEAVRLVSLEVARMVSEFLANQGVSWAPPDPVPL
jgi:hypothetical protein